MDDRLRSLLDRGYAGNGPVVVMTGAGISAESGIPTFRGKDGYWTVGSQHYHPQEMATHEAYERMPEEVWRWYLYRRSVCRKAAPNDAHRALVDLEHALGDRFVLITQNVDGLHARAGSSAARTFPIHGDIDSMRCDREDPPGIVPVPLEVGEGWTKDTAFDEKTRKLLTCSCGRLMRPHVLWFDESYDEEHFRFESSIRAATSAALLVVIGTSGQTNLPMQVGGIVARRGAPMIVINQDPSPFSEMAEQSPSGYFAEGPAGTHLPPLAAHLIARAQEAENVRSS